MFEARHVALGKRVAVKLLDHQIDASSDLEKRFEQEAQAASRIVHPGIVNVMDFGVNTDGRLFYVMEFLDGRPLSEFLAEVGPLPVAQTLDIGLQICRAMAAAHKVQLIHRDLKPENILLVPREDAPPQTKILDFGLAKDLMPLPAADRLTLPGTTLGTPEYMAPEQAMGLPADTRSDIYAVGVMLFELLTGALPYDATSAEDLLQKKRQDPPRPITELRADLPTDLAREIMRCLERDPDDRPGTMGVLAAALECTLAELPATQPTDQSVDQPNAETPNTPEASPRRTITEIVAPPPNRSVVPWIAGVAIAMVIGSGLALVLTRTGDSTKSAPGMRAMATMPTPAVPTGPAVPVLTSMASAKMTPPSGTLPSPMRAALVLGRPDAMAPSKIGVTRLRPTPRAPKAMPAALPEALKKRARALLAEGNRHLAARLYGAARRAFAQTATIHGFGGPALTGIARIAFEQGKWAAAVIAARRAVAAGGGHRARMYLGNAQFKLGRYRDAAKTYETVLARHPGHAGAKRLLRLARQRLGQRPRRAAPKGLRP